MLFQEYQYSNIHSNRSKDQTISEPTLQTEYNDPDNQYIDHDMNIPAIAEIELQEDQGIIEPNNGETTEGDGTFVTQYTEPNE